jgi:hypothetical protein
MLKSMFSSTWWSWVLTNLTFQAHDKCEADSYWTSSWVRALRQMCTTIFSQLRQHWFWQRIHISGLLTPLYLYQVFEVFMMFEMKLFQDKGYNVNNMRLEKVHCTSNSWIFWA